MVKAIVKVGTLRFEKGDYQLNDIIDITDEEAERLKESIKIMTPEQVEVYEEVVAAGPPEELEAPETETEKAMGISHLAESKTDFGASTEEVITEAVERGSETTPVVEEAADEIATKKKRKKAVKSAS